MIIVRTAMLRFKDRTSQGLVTYSGASDRLPISRTMKVHIDRVRVVDTDVDVGTASRVSSAHQNDSKVLNRQESPENIYSTRAG
jgi:hypothetical protein